MGSEREAAKQEALTLLGKLIDRKQDALRFVAGARETLVSTRAMWERLLQQDDVMEVTERASMEQVRKLRGEELGTVERIFKPAQEQVAFYTNQIDKLMKRLEALSG